MASDPASILADLATPGRTLAFCDETDVTHEGTSTMLPGIHLMGALVMASDHYAAIQDELEGFRAAWGLPEIHANEVVTPGTRSKWRQVERSVREEAFALACGIAARPGNQIAYVHVSKSQYADMRCDCRGKGFPQRHKSGVKLVFTPLIVEHLEPMGQAVLVMDRDKPGSVPTLTPMPRAGHLVGGGAVRADSSAVTGLQVADAALYSIGRYVRRRDGIVADTTDAFDRIAMEMLVAMGGRIHNLLGNRGKHNG
ncbi:hypothetical protein MRBLMA1_003352 [Sphingobium sp. LMA1-1-1.1]|uniref:hypothetical protein n=1 Tax=Sphingobium sp. LMA1-1-1.1 TaxID=3135238 RepID=UPI00343CF75E